MSHCVELSRMSLRRLHLQACKIAVLLATIGSLVSCSGSISSLSGTGGNGGGVGGGVLPGNPTPTGPSAGKPDVAFPATIRRLTIAELKAHVQKVLQLKSASTASFPAEKINSGFEAEYGRMGFSAGFGDSLQTLAEDAAASVEANLSTLSPCDVATMGEPGCLEAFLKGKGSELLRRPLEEDEKERSRALFAQARAEVGFAASVGVVVEGLVQSPRFIYRTELGASAGPGDKIQLTPHEIASALAFFLLQTGPDSELRAAAENKSLLTEDGRRAQVTRLLQTPEGKAGLNRFALEWLGLASFETTIKDDPAFTPSLREAMREETLRFWSSAFKTGDGGFQRLFSGTESEANPELGKIYGMDLKGGWQNISYDNGRKGILAQAALITRTSHGKDDRTAVPMGLFLQRNVLCQELGLPPPGVASLIPPPELKTTRDVSVQFRQKSDKCGSCHNVIEGPALPLAEAFDSLGRTSPDSPNHPDFGKGALLGTDVDGPFVGSDALADKIAVSETAKACFVAQLLSASTGKNTTEPSLRSDSENAAVALGSQAFAKGNFQELLVSWLSSDAFVSRDGSLLPKVQP